MKQDLTKETKNVEVDVHVMLDVVGSMIFMEVSVENLPLF